MLTDDDVFALADFRPLPDEYCDAVGLPRGTRASREVRSEELLAIARAVEREVIERMAVLCEQMPIHAEPDDYATAIRAMKEQK